MCFESCFSWMPAAHGYTFVFLIAAMAPTMRGIAPLMRGLIVVLLATSAAASFMGVQSCHRRCMSPRISRLVASGAKPIRNLPALRTAEEQAMLAEQAAAADVEKRGAVAASLNASAIAERSLRVQSNLESRLKCAEATLLAAQFDEERARISAANAAQRAALASVGPVRWFRRRKRPDDVELLTQESTRLQEAADCAESMSRARRADRERWAVALRGGRQAADEAVATADEYAAVAARATARSDQLHIECNAREQARGATVDDAITVMATSALLAESLVPAAGAAFSFALRAAFGAPAREAAGDDEERAGDGGEQHVDEMEEQNVDDSEELHVDRLMIEAEEDGRQEAGARAQEAGAHAQDAGSPAATERPFSDAQLREAVEHIGRLGRDGVTPEVTTMIANAAQLGVTIDLESGTWSDSSGGAVRRGNIEPFIVSGPMGEDDERCAADAALAKQVESVLPLDVRGEEARGYVE